jgi:hypothetical protein
MQNARAGFQRAQFELWIFSYTIRRQSSKKWLSRLMIAGRIGAPVMRHENQEKGGQ